MGPRLLPRATDTSAADDIKWIGAVQGCINAVLSVVEEAALVEPDHDRMPTGRMRSKTPVWPSVWPDVSNSSTVAQCRTCARGVADMVTLLRTCVEDHLQMAQERQKHIPRVKRFCRKLRDVLRCLYETDFLLTYHGLQDIEDEDDEDEDEDDEDDEEDDEEDEEDEEDDE